jgi:hypothetical protein
MKNVILFGSTAGPKEKIVLELKPQANAVTAVGETGLPITSK